MPNASRQDSAQGLGGDGIRNESPGGATPGNGVENLLGQGRWTWLEGHRRRPAVAQMEVRFLAISMGRRTRPLGRKTAGSMEGIEERSGI